MTTRTVAICALCFMSALFVFGIAGYFIFLSRIKTKKTAIKLKRQMKKNAMWWAFCWAAWLVIFFLRWNAARTLGKKDYMTDYGLLFLAGLILTVLLLLDYFIGKYAYITSQRVYFPDNFGLARQKKNVMYKLTGDRLRLWFNNGVMPKEFEVVEKQEELAKLLRDNYKLNKVIKD